jgi:hypothetical protein
MIEVLELNKLVGLSAIYANKNLRTSGKLTPLNASASGSIAVKDAGRNAKHCQMHCLQVMWPDLLKKAMADTKIQHRFNT